MMPKNPKTNMMKNLKMTNKYKKYIKDKRKEKEKIYKRKKKYIKEKKRKNI